MDNPASSKQTGFWLAIVLVLSFAAYAPALLNGFTFDDAFYVKAETPYGEPHPMIAELQPVGDYFSKPMNPGVSYSRGFRPVTVLSYALVHKASRTQLESGVLGDQWSDPAWTQHLFNLLAHLLATALVFMLVRPFVRGGVALLAAAVFGLHALHTEAIVWIVGRGELLAFVFGAAAVLAYAGAQGRRGVARGWRLGAVAALMFLACCSKESGVAWAGFAPLFALCLALHARGGDGVLALLRRQVVPWICAVAAPAALFLWLRHRMLVEYVDPHGPFEVAFGSNPLYHLSFVDRLASAVTLLAYGLGKVLLPLSLCCSYRESVFALPVGWLDPQFLGAAALLVVVAVTGLWAARRHPLLLLASGAFLGLSFLGSNLLVPIETVFAERLYYAPSVGLALLLAWVASRVTQYPRLRAGLVVPLAAWLLWCGWLSVERSTEWYDAGSLFTADAQKQPDCIELRTNLAAIKFGDFDADGGHAELRRALEINPQSPHALLKLATYVIGAGVRADKGKKSALAQQRYAEADALLQRLFDSPHYIPYLQGRDAHVLRSELYRQLDRDADALAELEAALRLNPESVRVRLRLMQLAERDGDHARYLGLLERGERHVPDSPYFAMVRGSLAHAAGEHAAAVAAFAPALPRLPREVHVVEAWCRLADSLRQVGRHRDSHEIAMHFSRVGLTSEISDEFRAMLASSLAAPPTPGG